MAPVHSVSDPGTKRVTSLKTQGVKALKITTDTNRNRVAFEMWMLASAAMELDGGPGGVAPHTHAFKLDQPRAAAALFRTAGRDGRPQFA